MNTQKMFTTIKVGYTAGAYGCSGEYFTTIVINDGKVTVFNHYGMYGSESRVNQVLQTAGFSEFYTPSDFGKMTMKDIRARKNFWQSEYEVIESINNYLNTK